MGKYTIEVPTEEFKTSLVAMTISKEGCSVFVGDKEYAVPVGACIYFIDVAFDGDVLEGISAYESTRHIGTIFSANVRSSHKDSFIICNSQGYAERQEGFTNAMLEPSTDEFGPTWSEIFHIGAWAMDGWEEKIKV